MHSDVVVLGDSNLSRATDYGTQVRSIEFHSYPGATIKHLAQLMDPKFSPQNTPKAVVLSVGINNRQNHPQTFQTQLKNMINNAKAFFPNASIHIPLINIPPEIPEQEQANINALNTLLQSISSNHDTFKTIPTLPQEGFQIDPKDKLHKIHWTEDTANSLITHWTAHLN